MSSNSSAQLAAQSVAEAKRQHALGSLSEAVVALRSAVVLYAEAEESLGDSTREKALLALRWARADTCQLCGDYLMESEAFAEAVTIYQEATDTYSRIAGAEQEASVCARKLLAGVTALRARPHERLYLMTAQYERQQRQLALHSGTEAEQAECLVRIARVFQRRERPQEAVQHYLEALALYSQAAPTEELPLAVAECHHRLATILNYALHDDTAALAHYQEAITLYTLHEPLVYGVQESRLLCERASTELRQNQTP